MKVIKGNFSDQNKKKKSAIQKNKEDIPVIYDEEDNYSHMLLDLIKPYMDDNHGEDELEETIQLGIIAWNLSISKSLGIPEHNESLKAAIAEAGFGKRQVEVAKKMEKDKLKKFPEYTTFIEDYEVEVDSENRIKLTVTCISLMDMMMEEMGIDEDDDEEYDDDDFPFDDMDDIQYEEGIVDRSAFSLKHKSAFIEWAKKTNKNPELTGNVIYLIEEKESEEEANKWLKKNFKKLMEGELTEVTNDKRKWPKLTYTLFCDFFEVQFHSMIWDTVEESLDKY